MTCILHVNYLMKCDLYFLVPVHQVLVINQRKRALLLKHWIGRGKLGPLRRHWQRGRRVKARIVEHQVKRKDGWMQLNLEN